MPLGNGNGTGHPSLRRRAGVVCVQCHLRKIKCDLQQRQSGSCTNCVKTGQGQACQRRRGLRQEAKTQRGASSLPNVLDPGIHPLAPATQSESPKDPTASAEARNSFVGYLAEGSFLSNTCGPEAGAMPTAADRAGLPAASSTLALPVDSLLDAFVDEYFVNLFPLLPVVDRSDTIGKERSLLLLQAVCVLGSHFRQNRQPSIPSPESFYAKVKCLLDQHYEKNPLTTLKALCLIACRSADSPTVVSLDGPWHWLGVAMRYAFSMGLHREATYHDRPSAGICRRIWWHLFNQDKLQSLCYGRPPAVRLYEIDTQAPTLGDFSVSSPDNEVFIQRTKLCIILSKVSDAQYGRHQRTLLEEATNIGQYLKEWIEELPDDLRLYRRGEPTVRNPYRRAASELHVMYFTGIILFYRLVESPQYRLTSLKISAVAASCTVHLMTEIFYRNEICLLLPINNWYGMVASVPLISAQAKLAKDTAVRRQELNMLRVIMREMLPTAPSTQLILNNIDRLESLVLLGASAAGEAYPAPQPAAVERPAATNSLDGMSWASFRPMEPLLLFPFDVAIFPRLTELKDLALEASYDQAIMGNITPDESGPTAMLEEFNLNFDFGNVQMDEFPLAFGEPDMSSFSQVLLG
ncbi:fungal-specific transcription factor domain-containing protein [Aspergillus pseudoustus]|uniref:Fungal-specific transcription factor domain-containing protein n=1 Tax=Aspergillus pseudoustus TaxID=1810923 RepID=A0ABR4ITE1_9EURO